MRATIANISPIRRRNVCILTMPTQKVKHLGGECTFVGDDGSKFRMVRCHEKGRMKTVFRVFTTMQGNELLSGEIVNEPMKFEKHSFHPWTADDMTALLPEIGVDNNGSVDFACTIIEFKVIESSNAHWRYHISMMNNASRLILEFVADVNSNDPVIPFTGGIIWSNPIDHRSDISYPKIYIRCGEYMALDFSVRNNMLKPVKQGNKWVILLGENIPFVEGSGIPITGAMLTFIGPNMQSVIPDPHNVSDDIQLDIDSLSAAAYGPVLAVSHDWDQNWLACLNIPRRAHLSILKDEAQQKWEEFLRLQSQPLGIFATRPLGLGVNPGSVGDQEDFAATKGTYAVSAHDPRHIYAYQYSIYAEMFRGYMHYETSGRPIDLKNHPNWVTWLLTTHWHTGVSPDRLNKTLPSFSPIPRTGYTGMDDEHRSQNNLAAYAMLTDDGMIDIMLGHLITADAASYRMKYPQYGNGAARAQGRTIGAWANLAMISNDQICEKYFRLMTVRWVSMTNNPLFSAQVEVPVLAYINPDTRKPIKDDSNNLLPTWSIWEHSLAAIGFYNALKVSNLPNSSISNFKKLLRTIVKNGCFQDEAGWWIVNDMWYRNGEPIPGQLSRSNNKLTYGRSGVSSWTIAALLVAAEYLDDTDPLKLVAKNCSKFFTRGYEADNNFDAEWWAAVKSVAFTS